ncbi:hypothetical protein CCO04_06845 [Pimelobacter sp. 30-1]|nr:hypothetical protein [Pimelobacter sp. 30-1]
MSDGASVMPAIPLCSAPRRATTPSAAARTTSTLVPANRMPRHHPTLESGVSGTTSSREASARRAVRRRSPMRSASSPSASRRAMVVASATRRSSYAWGWRVRSAIVAVAAVQGRRTRARCAARSGSVTPRA